MNVLDRVDGKSYKNLETNEIYELYPIFDATKIVFNLDGIPFKFDKFLLVTIRNENTITSVIIQATSLDINSLYKISETLTLPISKSEIEDMGEVLNVRFEMKEDAINKFVNPKFNSIRNLKQFFMIRDDIGANVILDFYYYNITAIEPPYVEIENISEED